MADHHSTRVCQVCGSAYHPRLNSDGSLRKTKHLICSRKCRDKHTWTRIKGTALRERGSRMPTKQTDGTAASCGIDGCSNPVGTGGMCNRHYYRMKTYGDPHYTKHGRKVIKNCEWCGNEMALRPGLAKIRSTCSASCSSKLKAKSRGLTLHDSKSAKDAFFCAKRRSALRSCGYVAINPETVFKRDKWRCHICGNRTDPALRGTYSPLAPELDHIVTLSEGGSHTWGNVACSCRACNLSKNSSSFGQIGIDFPA